MMLAKTKPSNEIIDANPEQILANFDPLFSWRLSFKRIQLINDE